MVGGIMGGLSMLGLAVPLLPIILKGILIAAVLALTVATANIISKGITGGKVIGGKRKENLERLRAAGIQDATKNKLTLINPETGKGRMKVKYCGENSISGREFNTWNPTHIGPEDKEVELDLMKPKHAQWYVKNYGQEALDEKLAAHSSFRETKTSLVNIKEDKQKAITEARGEWYKKFEKEGKELGFEFNFSKSERIPNTFRAHRLLWKAREFDLQNELSEALFEAYFTEGKDIGSLSLIHISEPTRRTPIS